MKGENAEVVLITDCGSTTTKALLFEKTKEGWRHTVRGEAPTTVEEPIADVTVGARNAFLEVEELKGVPLLAKNGDVVSKETPFLKREKKKKQGIDLYLSTSSAGGGLQMVVSGMVSRMTTESAARAALGAGAIVLDSLSADDGRQDHEIIERIRKLRPDIVLLTGGIDGGAEHHALEMAELFLAAAPRPRFGTTLRLPVIYAGNKDVAEAVQKILEPIAEVTVVENIRPLLEAENLVPAREAIHEFFLSHVMSHSPGYDTLLTWSPQPVMPTPAAVGSIVQSYAEQTEQQVLCCDIGGATTDVFSVFHDKDDNPVFNRTVSANLGMSYSIANVMLEAGVLRIMGWLPYELSESVVRDRLRNKMIRPTSIPQTLDDLILEQAVCREALRLSLEHHTSLAVGISGRRKRSGIADIFGQKENRYQLVDRMKLDLVIGSGGVLSHAPQRVSAALMMLDGFELEGITEIAVDSIFMMPHLGVWATVNPEAAAHVFEHDCLVPLAVALVPLYSSWFRGEEIAKVTINGSETHFVRRGVVQSVPLVCGERTILQVEPLSNGVDVGRGPGVIARKVFTAGEVGLLLDGRSRPLFQDKPLAEKRVQQEQILKNLGIAYKG